MDVFEFSQKVEELLKADKSLNAERSVYPLLTIAKGEDWKEMLWHMLRILNLIEEKEETKEKKVSVLKVLQRIHTNPTEVKKYFYAFIIGIMNAYGEKGREEK